MSSVVQSTATTSQESRFNTSAAQRKLGDLISVWSSCRRRHPGVSPPRIASRSSTTPLSPVLGGEGPGVRGLGPGNRLLFPPHPQPLSPEERIGRRVSSYRLQMRSLGGRTLFYSLPRRVYPKFTPHGLKVVHRFLRNCEIESGTRRVMIVDAPAWPGGGMGYQKWVRSMTLPL